MFDSHTPHNRTAKRLRKAALGLLVAGLLAPGAAQAQRSEISELWRELDVVRRQWRAERAVLVGDADRFRARRARNRFKRRGRQGEGR